MSKNFNRQARIDNIWGAHPDRDELLGQMPSPVTVPLPATATTATPYQTQLEQLHIQQVTDSDAG